MCQSCLSALLTVKEKSRSPFWGRLLSVFGAMGGFLLAWIVFYWIGRILISIPTEFHDGSMFAR